VEVVTAEMRDPETGAVQVLWPTSDPAEIGITGPDLWRTEISDGDWWETDPEPAHDVEAGEFQYFTQQTGDEGGPGAPSVVFHRALQGAGKTLCGQETRNLAGRPGRCLPRWS